MAGGSRQPGGEAWLGIVLVGFELLEPWPGRTWGQSHLSGLQKWPWGFRLRWHDWLRSHSQGWNDCFPALEKVVPGHLSPGPLPKDSP